MSGNDHDQRAGAPAQDWLAGVAAALGVPPVGEDVEILDLVRDVAHAQERRFAPLMVFLLGQAVAGGLSRDEAIARVRALV